MKQKPKITIEITPMEGTEFNWEMKNPEQFNYRMIIEALHRIQLSLHWDYVLAEIGTENVIKDLDDEE